MAIELDPRRRQQLVARLRSFVLQEFDEDMSDFRAQQLLDFFLSALGPQVYNQAVQDARKVMQQKLDDLDGEVHLPEGV